MNIWIAALAGLAAAYFALRWFVSANPASIASGGRMSIFFVGLALAAVLALTGRIGVGLPLAVVLFYLYGKGVFGQPFRAPRRTASGKRKSMVRSAALEMELDHETGKMNGRVLAGTFEGRDLDTLDPAALGRLAAEIAGDPESRSLLEVYLDRRMPRWREHVKADAAAGNRGASHAGPMSEEEAYQILGLPKGAGEPEIRAAHRRLMKKVHPDQGGSTFLAARINEAKDRLLSKHR
jgi:hypothetical protein